jgi:hypothetical protein
MTALDTDDLAVVTGPLSVYEITNSVYLEPGEVVRVLEAEDEDGVVLVYGVSSTFEQYINASSLTPLSDMHEDTTIEWGDPEDPDYVRFNGVHDYVYTGDDE